MTIFFSIEEPSDYSVIAFSGERVRRIPGENDQVRLLVQFKDAPMSLKMRAFSGNQRLQSVMISAYADFLRSSHASFVRSLAQNKIVYNKSHSYTFLFNGVSISTSMANYHQIASLPEVAAVYPDFQVRSTLNDSVPLIGAPQLWALNDQNGQPVRGRGIRVAVIDSGIDYTHPDLGGCFGPGCKVAGGYDFYNGDADPFDDNGHGTHVAGIIAANGTIKGVAPEATLLAYKVLGQDGTGWASTVIAALEAAVNPDGDPMTADGAHVINMSLGGGGNPDDPLSQAVDQAVQQGSVVVVAAGNEGGYATIGSPGSARRAITVAASTKYDARANFSSRGPIPAYWDIIKPDLIAPGVDISSTTPSGYQSFSGTSMAAPHVAGAAALLRQVRPSWQPDDIKANLMNNTLNIGLDVFSQGVGRLQVNRAASANTLIQPASLSFGMSDLSQEIWQSQRVITISNLSSVSHNYVLTATTPLTQGIRVEIVPDTFTLAGGTSRQVTVKLRVTNDQVPVANDPPHAYSGTIFISNGEQTWRAPYAFFKMYRLNMTFANGNPYLLIIHDRNEYERYYMQGLDFLYGQTQFWVYLPEGTYDIVGFYTGTAGWNIYKSVQVYEDTSVVIDRNNMNKVVSLRAFDHLNRSLELNRESNDGKFFLSLANQEFTIGLSSVDCNRFVGCPPTIQTSSFSSYYRIDAVVPVKSVREGRLHYYEINYHIVDGLNQSVTLQNDPSEFRNVRLDFRPNPEKGKNVRISPSWWVNVAQCRVWFFYTLKTWEDWWTNTEGVTVHLKPIQLNRGCPNGIDFATSFVVAQSRELNNWNYLTPALFVPAEDVRIRQGYFSINDDIAPMHILPDIVQSNLLVGGAPPHWAGRITTENGYYHLEPSYVPRIGDLWKWSVFRGFVLDQGLSTVFTPVTYTIELDNIKVHQSILPYGWDITSVPILPTTPGNLTITFAHHGYHVDNVIGRGIAVYHTNSSRPDNQPPYLVTLNVLNGSFMSGRVSKSGLIRFSVGDNTSFLQVKMFLRAPGGNWERIPLTYDGSFYTAHLSDSSLEASLQPQLISIRIEAEDLVGNQFSYTLEPAFVLQTLIPPAITSADRTTFDAGQYNAFTITTSGNPAPEVRIIGRLPDGLNFDAATATIHGTPSSETGGVYPLIIVARNDVEPDAVQRFTLIVNSPAPTGTATPTPSATPTSTPIRPSTNMFLPLVVR
ncbi:MAG: S8 family serine peptidase [Roseiflexaceae bacterium]|nr:S8 family serine peptidase [Roseiflexaceae bacterium]